MNKNIIWLSNLISRNFTLKVYKKYRRMFIVSSGKTIKRGGDHRMPARNQWDKLWCIYTKEFHAAIQNVDVGGHLLT